MTSEQTTPEQNTSEQNTPEQTSPEQTSLEWALGLVTSEMRPMILRSSLVSGTLW